MRYPVVPRRGMGLLAAAAPGDVLCLAVRIAVEACAHHLPPPQRGAPRVAPSPARGLGTPPVHGEARVAQPAAMGRPHGGAAL